MQIVSFRDGQKEGKVKGNADYPKFAGQKKREKKR